MSRRILFLIFGKFYESFRDTWFRDDFGIFQNVFRIHDLHPGISPFNIFIFWDQDNIFPFNFFSFFLFLYFSSFLHKPQAFPIFQQIPHTSTNFHHKYLSFSLSSMAGQDWPRETPHSLIYKKPLSFILLAPPSQIQILYKLFLFLSLSFFHFTSQKH